MHLEEDLGDDKEIRCEIREKDLWFDDTIGSFAVNESSFRGKPIVEDVAAWFAVMLVLCDEDAYDAHTTPDEESVFWSKTTENTLATRS